MTGGVSRHMLPHLSGVPLRLIVDNNAADFNYHSFLKHYEQLILSLLG